MILVPPIHTFREIWDRFIGATATQPVNLTINAIKSISESIVNPSMLMYSSAKADVSRLLEGDMLWKYNKWLISVGAFGFIPLLTWCRRRGSAFKGKIINKQEKERNVSLVESSLCAHSLQENTVL